jgi:hypothetical protein
MIVTTLASGTEDNVNLKLFVRLGPNGKVYFILYMCNIGV